MILMLYSKSYCSQVNIVYIAFEVDEKIYGDLVTKSYLDNHALFAGSNLCRQEHLNTLER